LVPYSSPCLLILLHLYLVADFCLHIENELESVLFQISFSLSELSGEWIKDYYKTLLEFEVIWE